MRDVRLIRVTTYAAIAATTGDFSSYERFNKDAS